MMLQLDGASSVQNSIQNGVNLVKVVVLVVVLVLPAVMIICGVIIIRKDVSIIRTDEKMLDGLQENIRLVAAIDIGTTFSGYASSTVKSFKKDPLEIRINPSWSSGYSYLYSLKTPTCVLLKKNGLDFDFIALGYEAQNQYAYLIVSEESEDYFYFEKFKMILYNKEINNNIVIKDTRGRPVLASIIFTYILTELKDSIISHYNSISIDEIKWVVTVPAIWTHKAKDFMRKCAEQAGMKPNRLLIALESEAVSVYFQYCQTKKPTALSQLDEQYLVVDIGGGTVDITAHAKTKDGELIELCKPVGDSIGGTLVDEEFLNVLREIIGNECLDELCKKFPESYNDIMREFEKLKNTKFLEGRQFAFFPIPSNSLNTVCENKTKKDLLKLFNESKLKSSVRFKDGKMGLDLSFLASLFKPVNIQISNNIKKVLEEINCKKINTILVVGGFSQSHIVQSELKKYFPEVNIITPPQPEDANVAVVKGAVLYGHRPSFITSRITQYTYGRRITPTFDENLHDPNKLETIDGIDVCKDVFEVLVEKNTSVKVDKTITKVYKVEKRKTKNIKIAVFITKKDKVFYVDEEGCTQFCELIVDISEPSNRKRNVLVNFKFGSTEFHVTAVDKETGKIYQTRCTLK